jgi:hypothetical protein
MHGAGQREYLTEDFLRRVRRAYKLAMEHQRAGAGEIWGSIRTLQQSVHEALVSEDTEALRKTFRDSLRSDLYYGVDHACRSFADQPVAGDYDDVMMTHIRAVSTALNIPRPDNPEEFLSAINALLGHHVEIAFSNFGLDSWSFIPTKGSSIPRTVQFVPRCTVNSVRAALASAASGCGLTRLYCYHVAEYVRDGRLKIVLADAEHLPLPVHLLTPPGRLAVPKVRAFIDFAVPRLRSGFARIAADAGTRLR